ncbi:hypothetical protein Back11_42500 [Paenibacillus baekrokdamisoli]|uniref:Uncharacterized protein n=1 Tax=Paenibacillus baekrokdamisoli TaxID=1712516 RepID=A0A3G9J3G8_9BACL|nr:hypothetical protein [Paenibacillus baekrokdamisoli]MBB3068050.1 hypothetical protein [Paenibacillus baekrokdamisoli]BBH22905.1 hypothetical protein Back11_42500 [Paenibacillus baekrokdamisoli]
MAQNIRLITDQDFHDALERQSILRVFKDDHIVDSGGVLVRFDDNLVVTQTSVSEVSYHSRNECEFFATRKR